MRNFPQSGLALTVPGSTSNLGAGFDTFGLSLQIYLTLHVRPANAFQLELSGHGESDLPTDESNLIVQTYLRACERFALTPQPLFVKIHNDIPLKRGLGSSGAAIAAGLFLAHLQSQKQLPQTALLELGCEIEGHPENLVASFLGGFSVNCYADGKLITAQFTALPKMHAALLIPELAISTEAARRLLPKQVAFEDAVANIQRASLMVSGLLGNDRSLLRAASRDRLHQPYRKKLIPGFDDILHAADDAGALAAFLSGSGSTLLALADNQRMAKRIATAMQAAVGTHNYSTETRVVEIDLHGARIR